MIRSSCPASRMRPRAGSRCRRRCQELPRGSRGSAMVRRASHREPVKTARPALSTAPTRCRGLACPHRSPGRSPRLPRGVGYCRIRGWLDSDCVFVFREKNHKERLGGKFGGKRAIARGRIPRKVIGTSEFDSGTRSKTCEGHLVLHPPSQRHGAPLHVRLGAS